MNAELSQSQRWFRRAVKIALVGVIAVVVYAIWPKKVIEVRTIAVAKGQVEEIVTSIQAGEVKSSRQASIRAITLGRVGDLKVGRGTRVETGQILVELESISLRARLRLARANLSAGLSAQRAAQLRKDVAYRALERSKKLAAKGALAKQALDRVQTEYDVAHESMSTVEANLAQLRASIDLALAALEESRIRAPFSGTVTKVHVEMGESVMIGAPILDLVDDSTITVVASVDEADAGRLKKGMPVRVECDAYPDTKFAGELIWIAEVVIRDVRQNRHFEVEVGLDGQASKMKVGMAADIEIIIESAKQVLFVPSNTIMRRGDLQQVYVVEGGQASLRTIKTGLSNWERTQVVEGLQEGDRVIVSLEVKGLKDGAKVHISGTSKFQRVAY
ncbi:MAG: efflux RND transporter periplasmic adaptor subunit [Deltaproteobacteria bacterium]|nr:efflux RND transporter periplasmic adaptor subunit [Deltaproteobacteria bacterium]